MPNPSYDLVAVDDHDGYRVTVVPRHGKTVTLYVVESNTEWWSSVYTGNAVTPPRYGSYGSSYRKTGGKWWYVKTSPAITDRSPGYITRHRTKEEAAIGANKRARSYGRACSTPLQKKAKR